MSPTADLSRRSDGKTVFEIIHHSEVMFVSSVSKLMLSIALLFVTASVGCNNKPDPRDSPDFNEAALEDPAAIKMDSLGGTPGKTQ
jgi:hypothetical protein